MFSRKYWLPLLVLIVAIAGVGLYLLQTQPPKQPIVVIKPVAVEKSTATQPPKVQTQTPSTIDVGAPREDEHFHDDDVGHAQLSTEPTPLPAENIDNLPTGETWRDGVWYPENYTQADIQADLAGQPAVTNEEYERRSLKHLVNSYLQRHWAKYPDCTEQELLLADAKDHAKWFAADVDYNKKFLELTPEFDRLRSEANQFMDKYLSVLEGKKLSQAERQKFAAEQKAIVANLDAHNERESALRRSKPIKPKPRHTH